MNKDVQCVIQHVKAPELLYPWGKENKVSIIILGFKSSRQKQTNKTLEIISSEWDDGKCFTVRNHWTTSKY